MERLNGLDGLRWWLYNLWRSRAGIEGEGLADRLDSCGWGRAELKDVNDWIIIGVWGWIVCIFGGNNCILFDLLCLFLFLLSWF